MAARQGAWRNQLALASSRSPHVSKCTVVIPLMSHHWWIMAMNSDSGNMTFGEWIRFPLPGGESAEDNKS